MSFDNTHIPRKSDIKVKPKWQIPMQSLQDRNVMKYVLEGEIKEHFIRLYPKHTNRRIMQWFGISYTTVQRFKKELGLKKNMKAVLKEHARDIKKICEANGYYDSRRGKHQPQHVIDAIRRKRASGFHPLTHLKETNPRKYQQAMRKRSEQRLQLVHKERLRMLYGLPRKTKINVCLNPIPQIALTQKRSMIKLNNYFAVEGHPLEVCYDSLTRRSARREATAIRHGLRIVAGEDNND